MLNASKGDWPHDKNITATTNATGAGPAVQPQPGATKPMSALDPFLSLDGQIQKIRQDHDTALKAVNDQLLATQIELTMTKSALADRTKERDQSERIALKFITQFGMVAKIFAEVQKLALDYENINGDQPQSSSSSVGAQASGISIYPPGTQWGGAPGPMPMGPQASIVLIDGVEPPPPTHDASWQNPNTGKWYDAVIENGNIMTWQERVSPVVELEPSDATKSLLGANGG